MVAAEEMFAESEFAMMEDDTDVMNTKEEVTTTRSELVGVVQLATDAVRQTARLVETVHSRFDWFSAVVFPTLEKDKMGGIAGKVYQSIHYVNDSVETGLSSIVSHLEQGSGSSSTEQTRDTTILPSRKREATRAVLNGVIGDYLQERGNPLAIGMEIRVNGIPQTDDMVMERIMLDDDGHGRPLLLLIHGSCMNDLSWQCTNNGHDHGQELAEALDANLFYLHYNSGLHISENGKALAFHLNRLAGLHQHVLSLRTSASKETEETISTLHIVAHSMGGLVVRSACHYAQVDGTAYNSHHWLDKLLKSVVFLGTPHHGAILERGGKWVDYLLSIHPYTEPFSWIGKVRSKGVTDLGYGNVRDEDWMNFLLQQEGPNDTTTGSDKYCPGKDYRLPTPLPTHIKWFAIAGSRGPSSQSITHVIVGDGLVSENSALGKGHTTRPELNLDIPSRHQKTIYNVTHDGLLRSLETFAAIRSFLTEDTF